MSKEASRKLEEKMPLAIAGKQSWDLNLDFSASRHIYTSRDQTKRPPETRQTWKMSVTVEHSHLRFKTFEIQDIWGLNKRKYAS